MSGFKYTKICKLERCQRKFQTNRKWQNFCCSEHQKEYWVIEKRSNREILSRVNSIDERLKKLEKT